MGAHAKDEEAESGTGALNWGRKRDGRAKKENQAGTGGKRVPREYYEGDDPDPGGRYTI
jgi:hypothetical protein